MIKITRITIFTVLLLVMPGRFLLSQELIAAIDYFQSVSQTFSSVSDYQAQVTITQGNSQMTGVLYYKSPSFMRIDFSSPTGYSIVSDNEKLMVALNDVVLTQELPPRSDETISILAGQQRLALLGRNYSVSYLDSQNRTRLDDESAEMVVKLRLQWRNSGLTFREIILSIDEQKMIRRVEATIGYSHSQIVFDFENISINQNIPAARFNFELPSSAYELPNFLFEPDD